MIEFQSPPKSAEEKETLVAFLNSQRAILAWKLDGLSLEEATRPMVPSGTNLLGLVRHLACVELFWFGDVAAQGAYEVPGEMAAWWARIVELWKSEEDPDADFHVQEGETVAQILGYYETAIGVANDIIEAHDLEHIGGRERHLRWILVHMIEETARHAGHADIVRELIDDTTGYLPG